MFRTINAGTKTQEYIEQPLVPDDVFAYKIVWNTGEKGGGILKVTALLSDGSVIYDTGTISNDGTAVYVLANSMYRLSGSMELRLAYVSGSSVLTDRILYFNVLEGAGEDASYAETKYLALDTLLVRVNSTLDGAESHLKNTENPHSVTKEQLGLSNVDNTSDMDKPVSSAVQEKLDNNMPVNKVKANNVKKVLLPALKGGKRIKSLHIGNSTSDNICASAKMDISLSSKNLIDSMNVDNWQQVTASSGKCYTFLDITDFVKKADGSYSVLGLSFDFNNASVVPAYLAVSRYSEESNEFSGIGEKLIGKSYIVKDGTDLSKNCVLDFSKASEYIEAGNKIVLACCSSTYSTENNIGLFYAWLSRFKYLQLEYLETAADTISDYNLGGASETKNVSVTLAQTNWGGTFISEDELAELYLNNSGTAELILETGDYAAPSDIYVEYYEDVQLKYEKMEVDLKNLISTNTAAIIANGGSE